MVEKMLKQGRKLMMQMHWGKGAWVGPGARRQ
jgi:hypothetical protein